RAVLGMTDRLVYSRGTGCSGTQPITSAWLDRVYAGKHPGMRGRYLARSTLSSGHYHRKCMIFCDTMRTDLGERAGPGAPTPPAFLRYDRRPPAMGIVHPIRGRDQGHMTLGGAAEAFLGTLDHPESQGTRRVYASTLRALRREFGDEADT